MEDRVSNKKVAGLVTSVIYEKLGTNVWSQEVALAALQVLSQLVEIGSTASARDLISTLCRYTEVQMNSVYPVLASPLLIGRIFDTMILWALHSETLYEDKDVTSFMLHTLTQALSLLDRSLERDTEKDSRNKAMKSHKTRSASRIVTGRSSDSPMRPATIIGGTGTINNVTSPTNSGVISATWLKEQEQVHTVLVGIKVAAENALSHFLTHLKAFPNSSFGPAQTSSYWSEKTYLEGLSLERRIAYNSFRYFIWKGRGIVGVIEDMEQEGRVTMVYREAMGRFCWDYQLQYSDSKTHKKDPAQSVEESQPLHEPPKSPEKKPRKGFNLPHNLLRSSIPTIENLCEEDPETVHAQRIVKWICERQIDKEDSKIMTSGVTSRSAPAIPPHGKKGDRYQDKSKYLFPQYMLVSH